MRANAFVAILICIAVFLAGCSADINSTESDTNFKGAETTVQTNQNDTEQYTQDTEISDVINDTAFGDYGRLIFPVNSSYYSGDTLGKLGLTWYNNIAPDKTVEIANYMKSHAENGDVIFYDIYTDEEKATDPAKEDTGLFFFKGNPGERFAVCNAGGGFAYVGAMHDSFPHALELSKMGYNAFALIYRIIHSPFGQVLKSIRENEDRSISLGYSTNRFKLIAFTLSAMLAGLAGGMKAIVFQIASLTDVFFMTSADALLMTLIGGVGTLLGPIVGAAVVVALQTKLATFGAWVVVIQGSIFVLSVLFLRKGIVGTLEEHLANRKARRENSAAAPEKAVETGE